MTTQSEPHSDQGGASSVEYSLMLALIAAVITSVVLALGSITTETFGDTCTEFRAGVSAAGNALTASC